MGFKHETAPKRPKRPKTKGGGAFHEKNWVVLARVAALPAARAAGLVGLKKRRVRGRALPAYVGPWRFSPNRPAQRRITPQIPSTCDSLMAGRFSFGFWCWWALAIWHGVGGFMSNSSSSPNNRPALCSVLIVICGVWIIFVHTRRARTGTRTPPAILADDDDEFHDKPAHAVPLASARQHPENRRFQL